MKMREDILNILKGSKNVVILTHISEDPDTLGSAFAMQSYLKRNNIGVKVYLDEKMEDKLSFLSNEFYVYQKEDEIGDIDVCLCVDCGDLGRLGERVEIFNKAKTTINIDHHRTNTNFANYNWVEIVSATCEIIYILLSETEMGINLEEATCLYTGLSADTGSFKYSNVTQQTHKIAGELLAMGVKNDFVSKVLFDTESLISAYLKADALKGIKFLKDGEIAIITITKDMFARYGVEDDSEMLHGGVDIARRIEGVDIAVCIKEKDDCTTISMRSNGDEDVSEICIKLGGGGHKKAAGARLDCGVDEAYSRVVEAII